MTTHTGVEPANGLTEPPVVIREAATAPASALAAALAAYARVPIAFEVRERLALRVPDGGLGGLLLVAEPVRPPYGKDYDAEPGGHPRQWPERCDLTRWGVLSAWVGEVRVGGAVVAWDTPGVPPLVGRRDAAVLWDLRVTPARRGQGVGATLFHAAEAWARARGAAWVAVETQNVNVPACRFYARQGCVLGAVHRFAYPALPDEVQLLWYKPLARVGTESEAV